jgi:NADH dehydrogenase [ubiquinone] 1 alpha subcomplex assembly factor 3
VVDSREHEWIESSASALSRVPSALTTTMLVRTNLLRSSHFPVTCKRFVHSTKCLRAESPTKFTNILAGANVLTTQVKTVTPEGVHLEDGRIIRGPCIFLEGKVLLWNVPQSQDKGIWEGWTEEHFKLFDVTVPKPGTLLGTS